MRAMLIPAALALATVAAGPMTAPAHARGCLEGAAVGGVAGHFIRHHAILGAIGGCIIGHHLAERHARERAAQERARERHYQGR